MKSILIIDDNKSLIEEIYDSLAYEGFKVFKCESGELGFESALRHQPDLVLCDILMPEMDGYEVLKKFRENVNLRLIPFIFISSLADRDHIRFGMEKGADDYLTKPFTLAELKRAIEIRLDRYYYLQVRHEIATIEKNITSRIKGLEQNAVSTGNQIKEIPAESNQMNSIVKKTESDLFNELLKSVETCSLLNRFHNQLMEELTATEKKKIQYNLRDIINKIERIRNKNDSLRVFNIEFNRAYPDFTANLTQKFPRLTQLDLILIASIIFNLNTNQIAKMFNITNDSVRKSKYRLKKKLNLGSKESLTTYIHRFRLMK